MSAIGDPCPDRLVLRDVEVDGRRCTVHIEAGRIRAIDQDGTDEQPVAGADVVVVTGGGGALVPGLHDHHLHLRAMRAALASVACGPPQVVDAGQLGDALRNAPVREGWIRGTGYHTSVAGELDRTALDALRADVPVRIQDRSGVRWHCNTRAVSELGLDDADHPGVERDAAGRPTGRLIRADELVRSRAPAVLAPWEQVGQLLATRGVTGCTDATVTNSVEDVATLVEAQRRGALPQRLHVLGRPGLASASVGTGDRVTIGQVKLILDEHDLPSLDDLVAGIAGAHDEDRGVAVHTVTRATLALTVAALRAAGTHPADRVEHASVCPPELGESLAQLEVTVVTQPNLIAERGERYRAEVAADDLPWLYPVGSLLRWGTPTAGSTDAPFGQPDPWLAIRGATERMDRDGHVHGAGHAVTPRRALELFLGPLDRPAGPARAVTVGAPADLCLLDRPLADALRTPRAEHVRTTVVGGRLVGG